MNSRCGHVSYSTSTRFSFRSLRRSSECGHALSDFLNLLDTVEKVFVVLKPPGSKVFQYPAQKYDWVIASQN